jgi:hypothetical protein
MKLLHFLSFTGIYTALKKKINKNGNLKIRYIKAMVYLGKKKESFLHWALSCHLL